MGTSTQAALTDVPVLYLLHGMGGNHSVWARRTSIERYVADLGIAVIMPSTDLAWYTDTQYDMNYWTFISEELPKICHQLFPQLSTKREKTFAAGLSMGGYGALKLGLAKPESFAAVASLSGAVSLSSTSFGELLKVRKRSYWEQDMLLSANQQMAQALEQAQASYTFETGPGEHDWVFWDEWIQKALAWLPIPK